MRDDTDRSTALIHSSPTLVSLLQTIFFNPNYISQGARFLKIDLAQLSSQKRFDFRNS